MAHAHKSDFVFGRNGRVHLNRRGRLFSRLLAAEVCASALVMLAVRHRVPSHFKWTLPELTPAILTMNIRGVQ